VEACSFDKWSIAAQRRLAHGRQACMSYSAALCKLSHNKRTSNILSEWRQQAASDVRSTDADCISCPARRACQSKC